MPMSEMLVPVCDQCGGTRVRIEVIYPPPRRVSMSDLHKEFGIVSVQPAGPKKWRATCLNRRCGFKVEWTTP